MGYFDKEWWRGTLLGLLEVSKMEADTFVTERYFELLKESRVRGYLFEQQNIIPKS